MFCAYFRGNCARDGVCGARRDGCESNQRDARGGCGTGSTVSSLARRGESSGASLNRTRDSDPGLSVPVVEFWVAGWQWVTRGRASAACPRGARQRRAAPLSMLLLPGAGLRERRGRQPALVALGDRGNHARSCDHAASFASRPVGAPPQRATRLRAQATRAPCR